MSVKFFLINSLMIFFIWISLAQAQETVVYRSAVNVTDPAQRVSALKGFIKNYPESNYAAGARYYIFSAYADLGKTDSALIYASRFTNSYQGFSRLGAYVDVASVLAEKKMGLDTAEAYSSKAAQMAEEQNIRNLAEVLDIRAKILYLIGKSDSALVIEQKVVANNGTNPDFLNNLSIIQEGAGKKDLAIVTAAKAILMGNSDEAVSNFNKWLGEEKPDKKDSYKLREKTVNDILNNYFKNSNDKNSTAAKSKAAVFLANTSVDLKKAGTYSSEALKSLNSKSSLEDRIEYVKNYAIVLAAEKKDNEALKELTSIRKLVDPWDSDFWYTLGKVYEKNNNKNSAEEAYIEGMTAYAAPKLIKSLKDLGLSEPDILKKIESAKESFEKFEPGKYKKTASYKGNIVMAELFTGAECPPCAGADFAFDALSEYFPRNVVAILEYHVHIPAPDPMTNPQTFQRYLYYGGNFGTPTVFIEGTEKITGGGPKFLMANRFHVYQYAINKFLNDKPVAALEGSAKLNSGIVNFSVNIKSDKKLGKNVNVHAALVEKSLQYPGGNGVTNNIFVVRALLEGAAGFPLKLENNKERINNSFDVDKIEKGLTAYLNAPQNDPSWRPNARFTGWRQRTDKINRNNLAVVVWLQNNDTKEIIQSYYMDVEK